MGRRMTVIVIVMLIVIGDFIVMMFFFVFYNFTTSHSQSVLLPTYLFQAFQTSECKCTDIFKRSGKFIATIVVKVCTQIINNFLLIPAMLLHIEPALLAGYATCQTWHFLLCPVIIVLKYFYELIVVVVAVVVATPTFVVGCRAKFLPTLLKNANIPVFLILERLNIITK